MIDADTNPLAFVGWLFIIICFVAAIILSGGDDRPEQPPDDWTEVTATSKPIEGDE